ncbi:hypothetical protein FQZ97_1133050 [compost metagenome]
MLPALAHLLEGHVVLSGNEAGVHEAQARAARHGRQGPGDHGVQGRAIARVGLVPALPAVDQAFVGHHVQHLQVDDPVPCTGRCGLEGECLALHRLEARGHHQPAAHQLTAGQGLPEGGRRVRQDFVDHDVLGLRCQGGVVHGSIPFKRVRRWGKRSRQKTP